MTLGIFQKNIKYLFLVIISIAVFTGTIIFGKEAANFFTRASSCPAQNVRSEKVSPNASTIVWETGDNSQGRVEYGTNAQSLTFSAPEGTTGKIHNVPLTLLTPNTIYYYLISIGDAKCDSTGQKCEGGSCVPFSFTTSPLNLQGADGSLTPAVTQKTNPTVIRTVTSSSAQPTSTLSLFCRAVQANIGKNEKAASEWATIKTYDIDSNGIINGLDVVKCQKSGK